MTSPISDEYRIVITGIGMVTPVGQTTSSSWDNMLSGTCGIQTVTAFDTTPLQVHRAGQIDGFDPTIAMTSEQIQRCGRASQLAIVAGRQAMQSAHINSLEKFDPFRFGVSFGTTMGEPEIFDSIIDQSVQEGIECVPPSLWKQLPASSISNNVAARFGLKGPNQLIPTACAAGNYAIGYAADLLRSGRADAMLVGGSDALSRIAFVGFQKLRAMAPEYVAPFDLHRKGMMVGEGAGALVMERLSDAKIRNAPIYAEFLGYGLGCDAHNMTIPHPKGRGGKRAFEEALKNAHITAKDVDFISAHGTGTGENDRIETQIIQEVLGDNALTCPVHSIKSMTGHCMGASSAIEAIVCCLALQTGRLPPTIHYTTPDPECHLDYIPNQARTYPIRIAVSNAYAFGGNASSIVLKKFG